MLNYVIDPALLRPLIPHGVELDDYNGRHYVSMVGFLFLRTRVMGMRIPWHGNFEEVNLRFYVRRRGPEGWRRAVVFIKEIVPRRLIASVARIFYNEPYAAMPMRHSIALENGALISGSKVEYSWGNGVQTSFLRAITVGQPSVPDAGSEQEFIAEHYWGYTAQRKGGTKEYRVEHVPWRVWSTRDGEFQCDVARLYGNAFVETLTSPPRSAFVAEGSPVRVGFGSYS